MLQFAHRWKVRCLKCGHRGEIAAATAELAKPLRCSRCDHVQAFAPDVLKRRGNGRRARAARRAMQPTAPDFDDGVTDLWAAG